MAVIAVLYFGRTVFVPIALAMLLSFVLAPLVSMLRKIHVPRGIAVAVVVLFAVGITIFSGIIVGREATVLVEDLPRYEATLRQKLKSLRAELNDQTGIVDQATTVIRELNRELADQTELPATTTAPRVARDPGPGFVPGLVPPGTARPIPVEVHQTPERPLDSYQRNLATVISPLGMVGTVLVVVIFTLLQREDMRDRIIRLVGAGELQMTTAAINDGAYRLSRYFLAQVSINATYGVVVAAGLWAIGVPGAFLWGIVGFLMSFIPYIGSLSAAVFPLLLAAAVDPGWTMVLWTIGLYILVEMVFTHLIEPMIQGQVTGLSPLAIVISAILWTALWGPIGLLLATPLTICLVVLGRHVDGLEFLTVLLGDQPALTPPEIFYQRLLAGASADAADQAEYILKTRSLVGFYDTVALPGLHLASLDAHRGALDEDRLERFLANIRILVDDLSGHSLAEPKKRPAKQDDDSEASAAETHTAAVLHESDLAPDWRTKVPSVLCLGARSLLDTAAAEILAQLLQRHGVGARAAPVTQLSAMSTVDLEGITLVWISSVDAAQSHAQIRYVVRRLRRVAPNLIFCGGLWDGSAGAKLLEIAGLAHTAATFVEALEITMTLAQQGPSAAETTLPAAADEAPYIPPTGVVALPG